MKILKKADAVVATVFRIAVIVFCCAIALLLLARVILRYTPVNFPMTWSDEVVEWLMAWMVFTSATLIMRDGAHFKVDLLQVKYADKLWMKILNVLIAILNVAFFVILLYYSVELVQKASQTTPILKVSIKLPYMSIPFNSVFLTAYAVRDLVQSILILLGKAPAGKPAEG